MLRMDQLGFRADIVVQLAPPCPMVRSKTIDESVQRVLDGAEAAVTLTRIEHEHPYRAKELLSDGSFQPFLKGLDVEKYLSRQELPPLHCTSGAIYTRRRELLEKWSGKDFAVGSRPQGILLNPVEATNIDRPIDFRFVGFLMGEGTDCQGEDESF